MIGRQLGEAFAKREDAEERRQQAHTYDGTGELLTDTDMLDEAFQLMCEAATAIRTATDAARSIGLRKIRMSNQTIWLVDAVRFAIDFAKDASILAGQVGEDDLAVRFARMALADLDRLSKERDPEAMIEGRSRNNLAFSLMRRNSSDDDLKEAAGLLTEARRFCVSAGLTSKVRNVDANLAKVTKMLAGEEVDLPKVGIRTGPVIPPHQGLAYDPSDVERDAVRPGVWINQDDPTHIWDNGVRVKADLSRHPMFAGDSDGPDGATPSTREVPVSDEDSDSGPASLINLGILSPQALTAPNLLDLLLMARPPELVDVVVAAAMEPGALGTRVLGAVSGSLAASGKVGKGPRMLWAMARQDLALISDKPMYPKTERLIETAWSAAFKGSGAYLVARHPGRKEQAELWAAGCAVLARRISRSEASGTLLGLGLQTSWQATEPPV